MPDRTSPVNLGDALASFADIYSPRIVGRVNDYDVRIAHAKGEHVWHVHEHTDEFFLVLEGRFDVSLREPDGRERTVVLQKGRCSSWRRARSTNPRLPAGPSSCSSREGPPRQATATKARSPAPRPDVPARQAAAARPMHARGGLGATKG